MSAKQTQKVRMWRILVTLALLATAVAVTVTTYVLLVKQEDKNFRNVVRSFLAASTNKSDYLTLVLIAKVI